MKSNSVKIAIIICLTVIILAGFATFAYTYRLSVSSSAFNSAPREANEYSEPIFIPPSPVPDTAGDLPDSASKGPVYSSWSSWITTPVMNSANCEVEMRNVISGYNLVVYVTQEAEEPHWRNFRSSSICGRYDEYEARSSYGEKHKTLYVSAAELQSAKTYAEGVTIRGEYAGINKGTGVIYFIENDPNEIYSYFIESVVQTTEYRYRYIY